MKKVKSMMRQCMKSGFLLATLLIAPSLTGCGGGANSNSAFPIVSQPRSVSAPDASGLTATLTESADTVAQGGNVTFTLTLTNTTGQPITLQLSQSCGPVDPRFPDASLTVVDPTGTNVYPGLGAEGPPCNTSSPSVAQTIAPGQTLTSQIKVGDRLGTFQTFGTKGTYTATARFVTSSSLSASATVGPLRVVVQ